MQQHYHPHHDHHFSLPGMAGTIALIFKPPVASADQGTGCKWLLSAALGLGLRGLECPGLACVSQSGEEGEEAAWTLGQRDALQDPADAGFGDTALEENLKCTVL